MQTATKEIDHRHTVTGEEQPERWWQWKRGRRVYTTVEPSGDPGANKRRNRARGFRTAYRKMHTVAMRKAIEVRINTRLAIPRAKREANHG